MRKGGAIDSEAAIILETGIECYCYRMITCRVYVREYQVFEVGEPDIGMVAIAECIGVVSIPATLVPVPPLVAIIQGRIGDEHLVLVANKVTIVIGEEP